MRRSEAPKSKAPVIANGLRARISSGKSKTRYANPTDSSTQSFLAVYSGTDHLDFLLLRGKTGVEAFDTDHHSIGVYRDQRSAADAVSRKTRGAS